MVNQKNTFLLIFVLIFCVLKVFAGNMNLYLLDQKKYPQQMCLDGSTSGFYHQKGFGDGQNKWIIFFQGGGACFGSTKKMSLQSCVPRLYMGQGSSNYWNEEMETKGIYQDDQHNNPRFYNWNKVFIPYCDGMVHQGYTKKTVRYLTWTFRFRGLFNTQAVFEELVENFGLSDSSVTDVLLGGSSAGGYAVFTYADYVHDLLNKNTKFWSFADSGLFINYQSDIQDNFMVKCFKSMLELIDKDYVLPLGCDLISNEEENYKCVLPVNVAKQVKSDLFIIESQYDYFSLLAFEGVFCIKHASLQYCDEETQDMIQDFRKSMIHNINEILFEKDNANAWNIACVKHGFTADTSYYTSGIYKIPSFIGYSAQDALYEWMYASEKTRQNYIDNRSWPYNTPCNGVMDNQDMAQIYE